ncbi:MAG: type II CAAX prenyl endopeptidase Rce1 family protein [Persicimonas sp.]
MRDLLRKWKTDFLDTFEDVERDSERWLAANARRIDWELIGLVILACCVVTFLEYFGGSTNFGWLETPLSLFHDDAADRIRYTFRDHDYARLFRLMYWSGCTFVGYMLLPMLYAIFVMGRPLRDFGLKLGGALKYSWIYVGLFAVVSPFVFAMALTDSFQRTYPFYKQAADSWQEFLLWELTYALQFLSLEFFFRGFLVHGLKHRFGVYAVLLSTIPYTMIHFGKPMPETLGAIFAGIALGLLALFTRSIWLGVAIHVSVAVSMDVFSLIAQGKIVLPF